MLSSIDISVVIVSFNTRKILQDCLDSIYKHTKDLNFEVVVVENGSTDGSLEMLQKYKQKKSNLIVINAGENLGFGKGNNLGVDSSSGKYLVFLNTDTLLITNSLKEVLVRVSALKNCGIYSCELINKDGSSQLSGGHFPTLSNLFVWQFFIDDLPYADRLFKSIHPHQSGFFFWKKLLGKNDFSDNVGLIDYNVDWVTGAFMVIPRKVFIAAGQFDTNIFMYTEEMELAYRVTKLGFKTYYEPLTKIIHLGGASSGSHLAITSEIKYMLYFWKKHMPVWQSFFAKIIFFVGSLLRLLIFGIIKQNEKLRHTYFAALKLCI